MEKRTLHLQLVAGKDLKNLNLLSKMDVYAVVSISGDIYNGRQMTPTTLVPNGGTNFFFNLFPMRFTLVDSQLTIRNGLFLDIEFFCKGTLYDKTIGLVYVPLDQLFHSADPKNMKLFANEVTRPCGRPKGELTFSYKFGDKFTVPIKPLFGVQQQQKKSRMGYSRDEITEYLLFGKCDFTRTRQRSNNREGLDGDSRVEI